MAFTEDDRQALQAIKTLIESEQPMNWSLPEEHAAKAFEIAEMAVVSPASALEMANSYLEKLIAFNLVRQNKLAKARKLRSDLVKRDEEQKKQADAQSQKLLKFLQNFLFWRWRIWRLPWQLIQWLLPKSNDSTTAQPVVAPAGVSPKEAVQRLQYTISHTEFKRTPPPDPNIIYDPPRPVVAPVEPPVVEHGFKLPITNAGSRGARGLLIRWLLATLNASPTSGLNWMEVTKDGLQIYQPLATVSQRTIKHPQLAQNQLVISVNPPAYFDAPLGYLKQFFADITTPWGEIVVYEGGGARIVASAVAIWPAAKIKEIRAALELLHLAANEHEGFRRIPRLRDMFIYVNPGRLYIPPSPPQDDLIEDPPRSPQPPEAPPLRPPSTPTKDEVSASRDEWQ